MHHPSTPPGTRPATRRAAALKYHNVELHNVCDIVEDPGKPGFRTSRYPLAIHDRINEGAKNNSFHGTAVEIRGMLPPGGEARITLETLDTNCVPPVVMVYHGGLSSQAVHLPMQPTTITITEPAKLALIESVAGKHDLGFDPRLVRVCLPPIHPVRIISIEGDLTYPQPGATPDRTMLSYGSSITHGAHAISPRGTYAAQCAWRLGCDLINLGVGGSARMDAAIAEHIAARDDWDFATFEMGINVRSIWSSEQLHEKVDYFVGAIAAAKPDKHLFCIDLFTNDQDFVDKQEWGVGFRRVVAEIAAKHNPDRVHYVDGRTILTDPTGLQVDLVHPNDNGMIEMGENLAAVIEQALAG